MTVDLSEMFTASDDVVSREVGGELILLNLDSGIYFGLNEVSAEIWKLVCEKPCSPESIREAVMTEFDVTQEEAEDDIRELLGALLQHGLIVEAPR